MNEAPAKGKTISRNQTDRANIVNRRLTYLTDPNRNKCITMPYHLSMGQLIIKVIIQSVQSALFCAAVLFKTKLVRQTSLRVLAGLSRDLSFATLTSSKVSSAKRLTTIGDKIETLSSNEKYFETYP